MRWLLLALLVACDAEPVRFREQVGVVAHLPDLDAVADAIKDCSKIDTGETFVVFADAGPELPEGQALELQVDAVADPEYLVCLGKALEARALP